MQIDEVISELGKVIGAKSLRINKHGVVHLTIDYVGDLFIDERSPGTNAHSVLVYLLRIYEFPTAKLYEQAMLLCDYKNDYPFLVNPVLHKEQALGFAVKFRAEDFSTRNLYQAIETLQNMQDKLGNSAK
ncbi:MAG: hypothetical protein LBJ94_01870 [Puniceicoccales bacterium]|jgi:hypothetical protein|nr:hypothetical protein [Puniceicoccales bacterium]